MKRHRTSLRDNRSPETAKPVIGLCLAAILAAAATPALANNSSAELGVGGILLTHSEGIELTSEDLFLSMDKVKVDYVFTNTMDKDIDTLVAFPMPDLSGGIDGDVAVPDDTQDNFLDFTTTIDGQAVTPKLDQHAIAGGIDVTQELVSHGVALMPFGEAATETLKHVPQATIRDWVARGIVQESSYDAGQGWVTEYVPLWTLRSTYWWRATFPAGGQVHVSHRYRPSVGVTVDLNFIHDGKPMGSYDEYRRKYCMDDTFMRAVARTEKAHDYVQERRLDYVLTSGGNWANGLIGRLHLTVDKGSADNLVSFCGTGVKKTGPTRFEMTADDSYPEKDIHILFAVPLSAE